MIYSFFKGSLQNSNWSVKEPIEIWEDQWALEINN